MEPWKAGMTAEHLWFHNSLLLSGQRGAISHSDFAGLEGPQWVVRNVIHPLDEYGRDSWTQIKSNDLAPLPDEQRVHYWHNTIWGAGNSLYQLPDEIEFRNNIFIFDDLENYPSDDVDGDYNLLINLTGDRPNIRGSNGMWDEIGRWWDVGLNDQCTLDFGLQDWSPAQNAGMVIPLLENDTWGGDPEPDLGAFQLGEWSGPDWPRPAHTWSDCADPERWAPELGAPPRDACEDANVPTEPDWSPLCEPEECDDGLDNVLDSLVDCEDDECWPESYCEVMPEPEVILIDEMRLFQTLDGIGANANPFPFSNIGGWEWEPVEAALGEMYLAYFRVQTWFNWWESSNDNADPYTIDPAGFSNEVDVMNWFDLPFNQWLTDNGRETSLAVRNVADWLASGSPRTIDPVDYPELAETITAYILTNEANGVPVQVAEVQNQANGQSSIHYDSPEDLRDAALELVGMLDLHGLNHVMLHGPNTTHAAEAVEWAEPWLDDPTLAERTAAISYQTWSSTEFEDYNAIAELASLYGKQVWATEVGFIDWSVPGQTWATGMAPETWTYAFDAALVTYRAIAWSHASRTYYTNAVGYESFISPVGERYPTFYAVKHFANYALPGATLIYSASGDPDVLPLVFAMPDGVSLTAVLINTSDEAREMRLESTIGLGWVAVEGTTSTDGDYDAPVTMVADSTVHLPPGSITSLWFEPSPE